MQPQDLFSSKMGQNPSSEIDAEDGIKTQSPDMILPQTWSMRIALMLKNIMSREHGHDNSVQALYDCQHNHIQFYGGFSHCGGSKMEVERLHLDLPKCSLGEVLFIFILHQLPWFTVLNHTGRELILCMGSYQVPILRTDLYWHCTILVLVRVLKLILQTMLTTNKRNNIHCIVLFYLIFGILLIIILCL